MKLQVLSEARRVMSIDEWVDEERPYIGIVRDRGRRIVPGLWKDLPDLVTPDPEDRFVDLRVMFEAARRQTPAQLKRCVLAVAKDNGGDVSKAFAICTKQLQKGGFLKKGTNRPTKKGEKASRSKAADKTHKGKVDEYEQLLAQARKERREDVDVFYPFLVEGYVAKIKSDESGWNTYYKRVFDYIRDLHSRAAERAGTFREYEIDGKKVRIDNEMPNWSPEDEAKKVFKASKENVGKIVAFVGRALSTIDPQMWMGSQIFVRPNYRYSPGREVIYPYRHIEMEEMQIDPVSSCYISVVGKQSGPGRADFMIFINKGKVEIDDVLEAGDSDNLADSSVQNDYFLLINELRTPGYSKRKKGKTVTVYTARPVSDRGLYDNAKTVPSGVFVTNSFDRAEGYAIDLYGSGGGRDIYRIKIDERYLHQTLGAGSVKEYQVIYPGMKDVPVVSIARD